MNLSEWKALPDFHKRQSDKIGDVFRTQDPKDDKGLIFTVMEGYGGTDREYRLSIVKFEKEDVDG
jgi:hypothetical protein